MKVTFINPPIKLGKTFAHYPLFSNLGMLQNAAILERAGFSVRVIDSFFITNEINYRPIENDLFHLGAELNYIDNLIKKEKADIFIVPITMFSDVEKLQETYIPEICNIIKKHHRDSILITADCYICGMNYFAYDPVKLLKSVKTIDINLRGETDITLPETLHHIRERKTAELPFGTFRYKGRLISKEDTRYYQKNLNELPYPAFHLLDMNKYFKTIREAALLDLIHEYHKPERFLPLMTSRGCLYSCNFCTQQVLSMPYRYYSVQYLKDEIRYFKNKYNIDRFFFLDNNINADINRFDELITFLSKMKISWDAVNGFRADNLKKSHIKKIKLAGNKKITVSAESGDPSVLDSIINKNLKLKSIIDVAKWSYENRIQSQVHYIIGMPGESVEKMNKTLEFAEMLYEKYNAWPLLQHAIPFRKTRLFISCQQKGYFARDPDRTPTHHLEQFPVIKTGQFSENDVFTIKSHFLNKFKFYETTSFIRINNLCNNSCIHCEISDTLGKYAMAFGDIKKQIQTSKARGHNNVIITGGEPTINNKHLFRTLNELKKAGFVNIALSTNGRMLAYRDFVKDIISNGINQITVSLNSMDPALHDNITSVRGSFAQTIKGIQNLLSIDFRNINISIRITSVNQNSVEDIIKSLKNAGVLNYYIRIALPLGSIRNDPSLLPDLELLSAKLNEILDRQKDINIKIAGLPFCMLNGRHINNLTFYPPLNINEYRKFKVKIHRCLNCIHYISCLGFYRPEFNQYYNQDIR